LPAGQDAVPWLKSVGELPPLLPPPPQPPSKHAQASANANGVNRICPP